jgi:hypothetical protein
MPSIRVFTETVQKSAAVVVESVQTCANVQQTHWGALLIYFLYEKHTTGEDVYVYAIRTCILLS